MKIAPGKLTVVYEVNHNENNGLDVISARFIETTTAVQGSKFQIAREFFEVFFDDMSTIVIIVFDGESKVYQVDD